MFRSNYFLVSFIISITFSSCSVLEPAVPAASFIHIDSVTVETDYAVQGSNSNNVTDAWVIYNEAYLGTFPLGSTFPVIGEGSHRIQFKAGIYENGINEIRSAYPKYNTFDTTINLVTNQTVTINPHVSYLSDATFAQVEDFDDASLSMTSVNVTYAPLLITGSGDPEAFEGNSGVVNMDSNHPIFEVASASAYTLPLAVPTYLELNYKCEIEFKIGLFQTTQSGVVQSPLLTIKPSNTWKKIYVNLNSLGGIQQSVIDYKVYLHADLGNYTSAKLMFDNLKVVY